MVSDSGKGSNWHAIAKVGGLACLAIFAATFIFWWGTTLGIKSGYYGAQSQGYASQYPNDTDKRIEICFSNPDIAVAKQCAQEALATDRENQRGEYDLQAQREVADWTYYAVVVSILQIPVGVFGLIALVVTIRQGQDAITKASEANRIAQEIGQAQTRAYLSVESARLVVTNTWPIWEVVIKNSGQSPAAVATLKVIPELSYMDLSVLPDGQPLTALDFGLSEAGCGSLAPGEEREDISIMCLPSGKGQLPENLGAIIMDPKSNCWVSAIFFLKWIDVFGIECDASGSFLARTLHPTEPNEKGIIGIGKTSVSTDVYDTTAWFKKWAEKQKKS